MKQEIKINNFVAKLSYNYYDIFCNNENICRILPDENIGLVQTSWNNSQFLDLTTLIQQCILEIKKSKPLFISEDGFEMFHGDTAYRVVREGICCHNGVDVLKTSYMFEIQAQQKLTEDIPDKYVCFKYKNAANKYLEYHHAKFDYERILKKIKDEISDR